MTTIGIVFRVINIVLMVGIPVSLGVFLIRKGRYGFRPIWIGALAFVLSQVVHVPFNQYGLLPGLRGMGVDLASPSGASLIILGAAAGLSAGIFEEAARYLVFRFWLKDEGGLLLPIKYAVGHGGVEAVLAGLLALLALVQVLVLGGVGGLESFSPQQADMVRSQLDTYWAVPWGQSLLGAWERVSAMIFHLGASLLVYRAVRRRQIGWLLAAVGGHAVFNAVAVIGVQILNINILEGLIFGLAIVWTFWAWRVRVIEPDITPADPPLPSRLKKGGDNATPEQLEESRYE
jgi:uncharacterized membrane protein YhfC